VEDGGVSHELGIHELEESAFMFSFDPAFFFGAPKLLLQASFAGLLT
jgi:hypothetical protein